MSFKITRIISLIICILFLSIQPIVYADSSNTDSNISFTIYSPTVNSLQYDDLRVVVSKPNSTYQISEVRAKVEGREIKLAFEEDAYSNRGGSLPGWVGHIDLNGLTRGVKTLEITAKDIYGNIATKQTTFKYTQPPNLSVQSPHNFEFTNGELLLQAKAEDKAAETNKIKVFISRDSDSWTPLIESENSIDHKVDISEYSGSRVYLRFDALNETGGKISITKSLFVDSNWKLNKLYQIDGEILDFKYNQLLYKTINNDIIIKNLTTGNEQSVYSHTKNTVRYGYLTPTGAMLVIQNIEPYYICDSLFEYKNHLLTYLGRLNSNSSLKVNGQYAIWNGDC